MNHAKLRLSLAVTLALASSPLLALGLGQIEVKSKLSEPLVAEIPIVSSSADELDSLAVKLASPDAFARVGLDRPSFLSANLEFSVGRNGRGESVIRVTTSNKVDDPYLSFLIEADWGSGKLVREFSVLLDPPYLAPAPRAQVRAATVLPAAVTAAPSPTPSAQVSPVAATSAPQATAAPLAGPAQRYAGQISGDQFGPVASGQTLSQIASSLRPGDVGLNQMMVALLRANPEAFIDGNVNQLKRGAILRIPGASELTSLSAAEAAAIVREQTESWQQAHEPQLQPVESVATASVANKSKATATAADARLRIVPPAGEAANASQSGVNAGGAGSELRAELSSAREDLAVKDAEINDLRGRVAELEKLRGNSAELLKLKDSELAALQQRLKELQEAQTAQAAQAAAAALAAQAAAAAEDAAKSDKSSSAATEPGGTAEVAVNPGDAVAEAAGAQKPTIPVATSKPTEQAKPKPPITPTPTPAPTPAPAPEEPSMLSSPMVLGGGALVVVGLLSWLLMGRSKGKGKPVTKRGSDAGALAASIDAMRKSPETGGDDTNADDDQTDAGGDMHDRLRELRATVASRPDQLEAHLAVLRYHYAHGEADDFEHAATDMLAHVIDPDGPQWKEACSLGRALCPGNGLFDARIDTPDDDHGESVAAIDDETVQVAMVDLHDTDEGVDEFEKALAELDPSNQAHAPVDNVWQEGAHDAVSSTDGGDDDLGPIQYEESHGDDDAIATKLDLAQAYLDIGDGEAARALLDEVMTEGSESQKLRAQRLLSDIG